MELDLEAIVATFLGEASERLCAAEEALVALERRPDDAEAIATIFRAMHTIKGNAGSLGFSGVAELTHALEDTLDRLRKGALAATPALVSMLLGSVDVLRRLLAPDASARRALSADDRKLLARLRQTAAEASGETARVSSGGTVSAPSDEAAITRPDDASARPAESATAPAEPWKEKRARTLRVDMDKLDQMLNLSGELAIAQSRLRQSLGQMGAPAAPAAEIQVEIDRLFTELQQTMMQARMVPLGPAFQRYARVVRDVALAESKQARTIVEGADVEVDTSVVEAIRDPLAHMVRNAVVHGIEPPERRRALGKDPCGRVTLRAVREAGNIIIEVADDGRGLDRERILARARGSGIASDAKLSDAEIDRLIFEPGVSTAERVTQLSGRGVGLDVVRRNVEALRGSVSVAGAAGRGTTITLRLPLTLAIIAGLEVRAGGDVFVVPLDSVIECVDLPASAAPGPGGRGVLELRGQALPLVRLRALFAADGEASAPSRREEVVVVRTADGPAGVVVDEVLGDAQTVIKPLGRMFQGLLGTSGATILGDGRVALILDVASLLRAAPAGAAKVGAGGGTCAEQAAGGVDRC